MWTGATYIDGSGENKKEGGCLLVKTKVAGRHTDCIQTGDPVTRRKAVMYRCD